MADAAPLAIETRDLNLWYGTFQALFDVDLQIKAGQITSLIGPSGCGKSTLLRSVNRINERLGYVRTTGSIEVLGHDIYSGRRSTCKECGAPLEVEADAGGELAQEAEECGSCGAAAHAEEVELIQVRKQVGMVFQRPNPLPFSIRDNVAFGYRLHRPDGRPTRAKVDEVVEDSLRQVLLWDAVKDNLDRHATELSLEQQQKLCIARLLPVKPAVLLMDEPCSALDPAATETVEELIWGLRGSYTILIVTHNMAQARRASEECVFMLLGKVVEHRTTEDMFVTPERTETADYIEGRFG